MTIQKHGPTYTSHLSEQQHDAAVSQTREDRHSTLAARRALEEASSAAAPRREQAWVARVLQALSTLEAALKQQDDTGVGAESLLSDIQKMDPRFDFRVEQLRRQLGDIRQSAAALRSQLEQPTTVLPDYNDVRQRLSRLTTALGDYQSHETDLIFEAYNLDLGQGD